MQVVLSRESIQEFYHDAFVNDQVKSFDALITKGLQPAAGVADSGGGCGYFAKAIVALCAVHVRVLDTDSESVRICRENGIEAELSDALRIRVKGDEAAVCFNLILHHLVGKSEADTWAMQTQALRAWCVQKPIIFVNEYIYESWLVPGISGRLIWMVTSNSALSLIGRWVANVFPSLKANTFGVGVRFRSSGEWVKLFSAAGIDVVGYQQGSDEAVSMARRLLLIKQCRRDSYALQFRA